MAAKFHCEAYFGIEQRLLFVAAGHITEGEAKPGMCLRIPLSGTLNIAYPIKSIELVHTAGGTSVAMVMECDDVETLSILSALRIDDEDLEIVESSDDSSPST